ncbi:MAG: BamA/TamA family outer membrane protein, partial [Burkholderiaceae bacterium]|nr:BamA/TamA family outer membrane protein [Burkholderiaceae bacterium]
MTSPSQRDFKISLESSARRVTLRHLGWMHLQRFASVVVIATAALSGCAALAPSPPASAQTERNEQENEQSTHVAGARAAYKLEIAAPEELRKLLSTYLDLGRFQNASGAEGVTRSELDRLVALAPAQARTLLETEGYFSANVKVERGAGTPPLLRVNVTPGPRTRVSAVTLRVQGPMQDAAAAGDPSARTLRAALEKRWPLQAGQAWRQGAWGDAKSETLAHLRANGYPAATLALSHARIDVPAKSAQLEVLFDSGPLFRLGKLKIEGLQRYDEWVVNNLAGFAPGTPYTDQRLMDFQDRLRKVGLFETASVDIETDPAHAEEAAVLVRLRELPLQQATVGVGISANTGPRVSIEHLHRRACGWNWSAKTKGELGHKLRSLEIELNSHPLEGNYRNLLGASAERLATTDEVRTSQRARVGRARETKRIEHLYYAELTRSKLLTEATGATTTGDAASLNYEWIWRELDSALLPTDGVTASAQVAGGYARASDADNGPFGRTLGRLTWYKPFGSSWYGLTRVEAGQVFAADAVGLPDTLLFRAGGDNSVRGYGYRSLGPVKGGAL